MAPPSNRSLSQLPSSHDSKSTQASTAVVVQKSNGTPQSAFDIPPAIIRIDNSAAGYLRLNLPACFDERNGNGYWEMYKDDFWTVVWGSNRLSHTGGSREITKLLCKHVFAGTLEQWSTSSDMLEFDINDTHNERAYLQHLGKCQDLNSVVHGRKEIVQYALAWKYLMSELVFLKRPLNEQMLSTCHRFLIYASNKKPTENHRDYGERDLQSMIHLKNSYNDQANLGNNASEIATKYSTMLSFIKPFEDGNRRVARILMNTILLREPMRPIAVGLETEDAAIYRRLEAVSRGYEIRTENNLKHWTDKKWHIELRSIIHNRMMLPPPPREVGQNKSQGTRIDEAQKSMLLSRLWLTHPELHNKVSYSEQHGPPVYPIRDPVTSYYYDYKASFYQYPPHDNRLALNPIRLPPLNSRKDLNQNEMNLARDRFPLEQLQLPSIILQLSSDKDPRSNILAQYHLHPVRNASGRVELTYLNPSNTNLASQNDESRSAQDRHRFIGGTTSLSPSIIEDPPQFSNNIQRPSNNVYERDSQDTAHLIFTRQNKSVSQSILPLPQQPNLQIPNDGSENFLTSAARYKGDNKTVTSRTPNHSDTQEPSFTTSSSKDTNVHFGSGPSVREKLQIDKNKMEWLPGLDKPNLPSVSNAHDTA